MHYIFCQDSLDSPGGSARAGGDGALLVNRKYFANCWIGAEQVPPVRHRFAVHELEMPDCIWRLPYVLKSDGNQ
jgi:hypothetical protein